MSYLASGDYDNICKNAKSCLGSVKSLGDKYYKLSRDHKEFKDLALELGLSTLTTMSGLEKSQFRCIKYMEQLDRTFIGGPTSALVESSRNHSYDGEVAKITSTAIEPNASRAMTDIVVFMGEAICADLSASSNAILSCNKKFKEEMGNICKAGLSEIDGLISLINETDIDF